MDIELFAATVPWALGVASGLPLILRRRHPRFMEGITLGATATAWGLSLSLFIVSAVRGIPAVTVQAWPFPWGLTINHLTTLMTLYVVTLSGLVQRYAMRYMQGEPDSPRFLARLSFATLSVVGFVLASNLLVMAGCWLATDWIVLALLAYPHRRLAAPSSSRPIAAFGVNHLAFGGAVLIAWWRYHTFNDALLAARWAHHPAAALVISVLWILATMGRSAQFPLHFWLTNTADGPTPVSALMHAGIVNSSGYLFVRLSPLWIQVPAVLPIIFTVGLITAIFGQSVMATQPQVKQRLVYSTVGQMGFMFMEAGLGMFPLVIWHMMAHGLYKATLFLRSGELRSPAHVSRTPGALYGRALKVGLVALMVWILETLGLIRHYEPLVLLALLGALGLQVIEGLGQMTVSRIYKGVLLLGLALGTAGYLAEIQRFSHWLAGTVPSSILGATLRADTFIFAVALLTLWALSVVIHGAESGRIAWGETYRNVLYTWLLHEGMIGHWWDLLALRAWRSFTDSPIDQPPRMPVD
ncbi:MAG: proton-conducting transporter membrane subunit [Firmicutes bacterium]|nr:proton-conducting transporter membrane subunit [Bacillota bacterium]